MNVLSLFDGLSCGMIALERAEIIVDNYFAAEIDKHAIKVSKHNYPQIKHIGDVCKISYKDGILKTEVGDFQVGKIDMLIGGSPCQSLSNLGDGSGLDGKSGLFYQYLRIKKEIESENKNLKFLLENVVGKKEGILEISKLMEVEEVLFNSNLVSAQNRARYYWTNIPFDLPKDRKLIVKDILEEGIPDDSILTPGRAKWVVSESGQQCFKKRYAVLDPEKANCLTARSDASWNSNYVTRYGQITRLTPIEYERLQTVPDGYTSIASRSERYKMLGNGWTVDVIAHILKGIYQEEICDSDNQLYRIGFVDMMDTSKANTKEKSHEIHKTCSDSYRQ
ncbi:Modification methylase HaeIII [compost metagenome]